MESMLLLHGAIGCSKQLKPLEESLKDRYDIHAVNFTGHAGTPIPPGKFTIELFAKQVLAYMKEHHIKKTHIFGYSLGGYVGIYLAKHYPRKIIKLVTLATKFYWDEKVAAKEIPQLNAALIESKMPGFAKELQKRHAPQDWKTVLDKTKELLLELGRNNALHLTDYTTMNTPCLLLLGDRDKMTTLEETVQVFHHLPNAQWAVLPDTPHPIEKVDVETLRFLIGKFC